MLFSLTFYVVQQCNQWDFADECVKRKVATLDLYRGLIRRTVRSICLDHLQPINLSVFKP